jgi:hydroxymethylglutaryl-CoA reductase
VQRFLARGEELAENNTIPQDFAERFVQEFRLPKLEPFRAVTHNKGIMNGVDAVVLQRVMTFVPSKLESMLMPQNQVAT